ncbi:MAG: hypothetical protein HC854_17360 [Flavobacterium sp.]|nr:hypothetical protein [Flavobacterium sp.]
MEKSKLEIVETNYRKLEDITNTCESLVEKVGHLIVDLFNNPDPKLEKQLNEFNSKFSARHQELNDIREQYQIEKLYPLQGVETFNSTEEERES